MPPGRVETLLAFTSSLTVFAPEASERVQKSGGRRICSVYETRSYIRPGTIPEDAFMVLAATDDAQE